MTTVDRPQFCIGAVVVHDGHLLLIRRGRAPEAGRWSVPGGRLEHGETMAAGVAREVAEETGVAVECGELAVLVERVHDTGHVVIADFFATAAPGPRPDPVAGDDADDARWVALDEVGDLDLVEGLFDVLADLGVVPIEPFGAACSNR